MMRFMADENGKIVGSDDATPACGEGYCDDCGDCLACCSGDPCRAAKNGQHRWVVYLGGVAKAFETTTVQSSQEEPS